MTTTAEPQGLLVRLLDPSNRADPYSVYREILTAGPLLLPEGNLVVFSSFQDCGDVLRHPSSASDRLKSTVAQREIAKGAEPRPFGQPGFLFLDPPDHTRLRKLAQQAFAPKRVRALEADIAALVDGLLDEAAGGDGFDAVADLAYPLPVAVICRMLGVPIADEPEFGRASALLAQGLDPFVTFTGELPESFAERMTAGHWLREYIAGLVEDRRSAPQGRPDLGVDRRRGGRRPADDRGDRRDVQPAADRRSRDDGEPDRQRDPGDGARTSTLGRSRRRPRQRRGRSSRRRCGTTRRCSWPDGPRQSR